MCIRDSVITARLKSKAAPDSEGEGRIPSSESGQDFDVTYQLSSFRSEAPLPTITESCTFDTTESRCRMVTDYDFRSGQSSERWECVQVPVTLPCHQTTPPLKGRRARTVDGEGLDPNACRPRECTRPATYSARKQHAPSHRQLPGQ